MSATPTNPAPALTAPEAELLARRREIAETGIAIADEQGIDAVSMRNIATRLGVGTMTLYTWIENKDDLIAVMADALADQMLVPEPMPADWRAALTQIAIATRDVFTSHPWMLSGGRTPGRIGANMLRHVDQSLRAVSGLDLEWPQRASILQAIDHYALGYAVANQRREQRVEALRKHDGNNYGAAFKNVAEARAHKARTEAPVSRGETANAIELRALFESGEATALSEMFGSPEQALERIKHGPPKIEGDFDDGLRWMLDGIAAMLERDHPR
ncbi:MAG: TetR/AcrR family transcriptional regulator [Thermoleophilaceae bacterium]|nr:TetR/AcrR family transcriptional regulator [Thermoleophilaceae bacterium]